MSTLNAKMHEWLPPALARWIRLVRGVGNRFEGNYANWEEAAFHCTGYDSSEIFRRVRDAASSVKRNEAVFERDGVCFYHEEYNWEVLACLMLGAAEQGGSLNVLDFGGALGGFYFQHRRFFAGLSEQRWGIVEQKHYVECGRNEFENDSLRFYSSVDECAEKMPINMMLLSSVLQYLERPFEHLFRLGSQNVRYIIIDRTPFVEGEKDRLVIQHVPQSIFPARLPMWIFSEKNFESAMNGMGYFRVACFPSAEGRVGMINFRGILYRREKQ